MKKWGDIKLETPSKRNSDSYCGCVQRVTNACSGQSAMLCDRGFTGCLVAQQTVTTVKKCGDEILYSHHAFRQVWSMC